jgi:tRNA G26 N,N-dimethylase Trm1
LTLRILNANFPSTPSLKSAIVKQNSAYGNLNAAPVKDTERFSHEIKLRISVSVQQRTSAPAEAKGEALDSLILVTFYIRVLFSMSMILDN